MTFQIEYRYFRCHLCGFIISGDAGDPLPDAEVACGHDRWELIQDRGQMPRNLIPNYERAKFKWNQVPRQGE